MFFPATPDALPLNRDFVDHLDAVAAGWGTVNERGRLRFAVRAPKARWLSYLAAEPASAALARQRAGQVPRRDPARPSPRPRLPIRPAFGRTSREAS